MFLGFLTGLRKRPHDIMALAFPDQRLLFSHIAWCLVLSYSPLARGKLLSVLRYHHVVTQVFSRFVCWDFTAMCSGEGPEAPRGALNNYFMHEQCSKLFNKTCTIPSHPWSFSQRKGTFEGCRSGLNRLSTKAQCTISHERLI